MPRKPNTPQQAPVAELAIEESNAPDLTPLLDQLETLAGKTQFYAEHGHAPWLQNQLLSLISQLRASL